VIGEMRDEVFPRGEDLGPSRGGIPIGQQKGVASVKGKGGMRIGREGGATSG